MQAASWHFRDWISQQTHPLPAASEPPLRAELFSGEQLTRHAKGLAAHHQVVSRRTSDTLLVRLDQNEKILADYNPTTYITDQTRRVTARLLVARRGRDLADLWGNCLQDMAGKQPSHLVVVVADMAKAELPFSSVFVAEFCQRLSRQHPAVDLVRSWLEQRLAEQGLSIVQLVHLESQNQAADQMSVSHTITSIKGRPRWNVRRRCGGRGRLCSNGVSAVFRWRFMRAAFFRSRRSELSGWCSRPVRQTVLPLVRELRRRTNLGITLCLGTLSPYEYDELREAGGDYYVIKIETGNTDHFKKISANGPASHSSEAAPRAFGAAHSDAGPSLPKPKDSINHLAWRVIC
jgi:hypothetical protein